MAGSVEKWSAPIIDFGAFMRDEGVMVDAAPTESQLTTAAAIDKACRDTGFMCLKNIGLTEDDLQRCFAASAELFALPAEHKLSKLSPINPALNIGFAGYGSEKLNVRRAEDLKEAFNVRSDEHFSNDFRGCPVGFEKVARDLFQIVVQNLTHRFCIACALALGLERDFFAKRFGRKDSCTIRFLHYPPCEMPPGGESGFAIRAGEHTDFGMFTVLFIQGEGTLGLQVKSVEGGEVTETGSQGWVDVPSPGGAAAVINTGALLARWTNDVWCATAHRVVVPGAEAARQHRYSVACFFDPDAEEVVEVHPKLVAGDSQAKYPPIKASDYLKSKLNSMMLAEETAPRAEGPPEKSRKIG